MSPSQDIDRLLEIMAALRTPGSGCPWDLEQRFETIAPYTIEEAYEVADAIERRDMDDLRDELGDLLLQVVFHARLAEEEGRFAFPDVVGSITQKLIRRHPHVFGDARTMTPEAVKDLWATIKAEEKAEKRRAQPPEPARLLDDVPHNLPALTRAAKLQAKAARVGFDWDDAGRVMAKLREEIGEVEHALEARSREDLEEEIGDLFFAAVNLARHHAIDPEASLRAGNAKFVRRFAHIEQGLSRTGRALEDADLTEMEALWNEAKELEKAKKAA